MRSITDHNNQTGTLNADDQELYRYIQPPYEQQNHQPSDSIDNQAARIAM